MRREENPDSIDLTGVHRELTKSEKREIMRETMKVSTTVLDPALNQFYGKLKMAVYDVNSWHKKYHDHDAMFYPKITYFY